MKTTTIIAAYLLVVVPFLWLVARIIRAGTDHLDRPLPPESLRDGPWGPPRI